MNNKTGKGAKTESADLRQEIIRIVGSKSKTDKKALFTECLKIFQLTAEEKKDRSSGGKLVRCKSLIGSVLSEMLRDKVIEQDENGFFRLPSNVSAEELITEERVEEWIIALMQRDVTLTKKQIFAKCEEEFRDDAEQRGLIHNCAGNVLARLIKNGVLVKLDGGLYKASIASAFPNTELGNCLKKASEGKEIKKYFLQALNLKGGEFFEEFSVNLIGNALKKNGAKILKNEVTGGSDDNGIDGKIEYEDTLGFRDSVYLQAKTRGKGTVTLKEVREFLGAVVSEKGAKGVFVTTTSFHSEAAKFLNRNKSLVGIDGNKVFKMAAQYGMGTDGNSIDTEFFLDPMR